MLTRCAPVLLRVRCWAHAPGLVVLGPDLCIYWPPRLFDLPGDAPAVWTFTAATPRLHLYLVYDDTGEEMSDIDRARLRDG